LLEVESGLLSMATRAFWKGYLRLSLVTIGIELYSAVSRSSQLSLHQIHKPSGKRVRYQKVAPGLGPVDTDEIVKGYEVGEDSYVLLSPEELDAIKLESKHTIDLVQFVEHCEIDPRYFDKPYYIVPRDAEVAAEGYAVIRDALRGNRRVALGQMASRGRDSIVAIKPCGDGLLLETLRYSDEIRASDEVFSGIPEVKVEKEMLALAGELIERKSAPFKPELFHSQYQTALRELIEEKQSTGKVAATSEEELGQRGGNVIDLMAALKRSVARDKPSAKAPAKARTKARTKTRSPSSGSGKRSGGKSK
jgi:DNA end-binding protein Ku